MPRHKSRLSHVNVLYTMMEDNGESKSFIYPSSKSWHNPEDISLPLNHARALKVHSQRPEAASNSNKNQPPFA